jgi:anthranilate synthase component 2
MAKVLFIDNFDSFTYNLVDEIELLGHEVTVVRNTVATEILVELSRQHQLVVISPGPGNPQQAGNCMRFLQRLENRIPILGICLGHQLIIEHAGGSVGRADKPMHGKASFINHNGSFCFSDLPNPMQVGRYHSLTALNLPSGFEVLAKTEQQIMAVFDPVRKMLGFQFHPESLLTTYGSRLLANSIEQLLNLVDERKE